MPFLEELAAPAMAKEKDRPEKERIPLEITKIDARTLEKARVLVALERKAKGKDKARGLAEFLSDILRPQIDREYRKHFPDEE